MKKNFFKKLSFVLALAMIISAIAPAASAFAATSPKLNATKKYLYLSSTNEFDFNVANKQSGWKYAWVSSDEDVVTVDSVGLATAVAVGTAKVTVDITDKKGADVAELSADVVVRDNISSITEIYFQGTPADQDLKALKVATDYDFGRKFTTDAGSTTVTSSKTLWTVNSTKATISTTGVFKATEAGDYTITARAFQSTDKMNAWVALKDATSTAGVLASKTLDVKVVNEISKVEQVDATTAKVTFASPVANTTDLTVSTLVAATNTKIKQTVKEVKLSDDKTVATVTMYANFAAGTTYTFDYAGIAAGKSFVGATSNLADVASMAVTTTTLVADATAHAVVIKLYNAAGVDISSLNPALVTGYVTMTSTSEKVYANGQTLTFFNVGDTTSVTATFHTYTYNTDGTEKGVLTATGTVTGVAAAAAASVSAVTAYTIATGAPDFSAVNTILAAEDAGYKFYAKAVKTDGTNYVQSNVAVAGTGWRFSSSDPSTLIVAADGTLYPVKAGAANVIVEYCANTAAATPVWAVIGAPSVTVSAKRVATQLNLSTYAVTVSNTVNFVDSAAVTAEVKDQYGVVMATKDVSVTENANTIGGVDPIVAGTKADGTTSFTFVGSAGVTPTAAGTYTYAIKANGLTKYVVVNVLAPTAGTVAAASYQLSVGSSYDEKITSSTAADIVANIEVIGYAANGVAWNKVDGTQLAGLGLSVKAYTPSGANDGILTLGGAGAAAYSVTLVDLSGTPSTKLATGTYTFRLYATAGTQLVDTKSFTVTDTQPKATATVKALVAPTAVAVLPAILECFDVKDSTGAAVTVTTNMTVDIIGADVSGTSVFVKNINLTETIGGGTVVTVIPVNTLITLH